MFKKISVIVASVAVLSACSGTKDYTPPAGATGIDMYTASCASCHNGEFSHWKLEEGERNAEYIQKVINSGTMGMPSFPNIKGEQLETLTQFVLENSAK